MIFPTVHLNGTSADSLLEDLQKASNALRDAADALRAMSPNGRDYYVQGPRAHDYAVAEHETRIQCVRAVLTELDEIAENVIGQRNERDRMRRPRAGTANVERAAGPSTPEATA